MTVNDKKEFIIKAHDSSLDHLKLSSEEEDSEDEEDIVGLYHSEK